MKIVKLPKENLAGFIRHLNVWGEIHAPMSRML